MLWVPPAFTSCWSWNGRTQPSWGLFGCKPATQVLGRIPLAPGNVPKYESKLRFSCMMTITCLIGTLVAVSECAVPDTPWQRAKTNGMANAQAVLLGRKRFILNFRD